MFNAARWVPRSQAQFVALLRLARPGVGRRQTARPPSQSLVQSECPVVIVVDRQLGPGVPGGRKPPAHLPQQPFADTATPQPRAYPDVTHLNDRLVPASQRLNYGEPGSRAASGACDQQQRPW